jgi:DNA-directed RNA polymerase specialized sigma24 family protein
MDPTSPTNKKSELTPEAFDRLMLLLDADRERAGEKYELLRLKLKRFFNSRASRSAEERADEVLDRLAKRAAEGEEIRNPSGYCLGIARLVWLESLRNPEARQASFDDMPVIPLVVEDGVDRKLRMDCFNRCLREIPEPDGALLVEYYFSEQGEDTSMSENRLRIAERLQVPLNALRIRVHRIRAKFNECFELCLAQGPKRLKYN